MSISDSGRKPRIKHVFQDEREVAHLWMAHSGNPEVQDNARNRQSNFYYKGLTIYSYGSHFPIARVVRNGPGKRAVLFTTQGWSKTTAGHISTVRNALDSALPVFYVTNPYAAGAEVVQDYAEQIENVVQALRPRAIRRTKLKALDRITHLVGQANAYAEWWGIPDRLTVPESLEQVIGDIAKAKAEAERQAEAERRKREAKQKRENTIYRRDHAKYLDVWRETGKFRCVPVKKPRYPGDDFEHLQLHRWDDLGDLLRIDHAAGEVETSRGARVPLDHAEKAYRFVAAVRAKGKPWESNGHTVHVGHYRIDRIEATGEIKAGCHRIHWPEIERLAKDAGWLKGSEPEAVVHA